MILALVIALAVFFSVFGRADSLALAGARTAVAAHEGLLHGTSVALSQNLEALRLAQAALESVKKAEQR